jgi:hypothetical protein
MLVKNTLGSNAPPRTKAEIESSPEKPEPLPVEPDGIPDELKALNQWVAWNYERDPDRDKWTKVPINTRTGRKAKANDPSTWGTFQEALAYYRKHRCSGIGFEFSVDDPYCGIDLDNCRDPDSGQIQPATKELLKKFPGAYVEISPSGTGTKFIIRGKLPPEGNRKDNIEIYDEGQYFALTGNRLDKFSTEGKIANCQKQLDQFHASIFQPKAEPPTDPPPTAPEATAPVHKLSDEEVDKVAQWDPKYKKLFAGDWSGYPSPSEADEALCCKLAFYTAKDKGQIDRLFRRSKLYRPKKWGREDYRNTTIARAISWTTEVYKPARKADGQETEDSPTRASQSTQLVDLCLKSGAKLFHNDDKDAFATVPPHHATYPVFSKPFKLWLSHLYYKQQKRNPATQALQDALNTISGHAIFSGPNIPLFVRVACLSIGTIYLDLGNDKHEVVEITPNGWTLLDKPPDAIKFRRFQSMRALPAPVRGGTLALLRPFLNVKSESDFYITSAWLLGSFHPNGPYSILCVHGEQGAAKSTLCKVLKELIDPSGAELRSPPRDERDLWIAASNSHVTVLNNVSYIPAWLSDAVCRLTWDGGYATRKLYTDNEETIFDRRIPLIINGIENMVTRGDLADRGLQIVLPAIKKEKRRDEEEFWASFGEVQPKILGALLDCVAAGLANIESVNIPMPRMADFTKWVVACEPATGFPEGSFLTSIEQNIEHASDLVLEASIVAGPLRSFMERDDKSEWRGPAKDLLYLLSQEATDRVVQQKEWPKQPHFLTNHLRRLAPNLRKIGIDVTFVRSTTEREILIQRESFCNSASLASSASSTSKNQRQKYDAQIKSSVIPASSPVHKRIDDAGDDAESKSSVITKHCKNQRDDAHDAHDAVLQKLSCDTFSGNGQNDDSGSEDNDSVHFGFVRKPTKKKPKQVQGQPEPGWNG